MKHVIIGAGPAGVIAAETLRKADPDAQVTLVGDEPEPPYSRMAIPYFLVGNIEDTGTHLRKTDGHFDHQKIDVVRARVQSVANGAAVLDNGQSLEFDRLLVASGSRPLRPPVPGLERAGVHHCWTLADARDIAKAAQKGANVVLMGAGFIGCIILEALAEREVNLTVVEMGDRMVPRMMDDTAGNMIKRWCEAKGVHVLTSAKVTEVKDGSGSDPLSVVTQGGEILPASLVVVATGVRPNVEFLDGSGVEIDQGIVVDNHLQSSVPGIYAAGDVAQGPDFSTGGKSVHAVQPTAADHGRIAAINMAGGEASYKGSLVMNTLDTLGLISTSFGLWQGVEGGESTSVADEDNFRYMQLQFDGDKIVGAINLGLIDHVGVLRGLIQSKVSLGAWKDTLMRDPHRVMEAYLACTQG